MKSKFVIHQVEINFHKTALMIIPGERGLFNKLTVK